MHRLRINDHTGQSQVWWFNFLSSLRADTISREIDLAAEFRRWGAELGSGHSEVLAGTVYDSIVFARESDLTYFLLRWS